MARAPRGHRALGGGLRARSTRAAARPPAAAGRVGHALGHGPSSPAGWPSSRPSWPTGPPRSWGNRCPASSPAPSARRPTASSAPPTPCGPSEPPIPAPRGGGHGSGLLGLELPGAPGAPVCIGHQSVAQALADLPYLPEETPQRLVHQRRRAHMADIAEEFEQGVASLAPGGDVVAVLDALAVGGAQAYLRNAESPERGRPRPCGDRPHGARAGAALAGRRGPRRRLGLRLAGRGRPARGLRRRSSCPDAPPRPAPAGPIERAVASGDAHAIKLAEAAVRCYAPTKEPALLIRRPPTRWPDFGIERGAPPRARPTR